MFECEECGKTLFYDEEYEEHMKLHKESFYVYAYEGRFLFSKQDIDFINISEYCVYAKGNRLYKLDYNSDYDGCLLTTKDRLGEMNFAWRDLCIFLNIQTNHRYEREEMKKMMRQHVCKLFKEKIKEYQQFIDKEGN